MFLEESVDVYHTTTNVKLLSKKSQSDVWQRIFANLLNECFRFWGMWKKPGETRRTGSR